MQGRRSTFRIGVANVRKMAKKFRRALRAKSQYIHDLYKTMRAERAAKLKIMYVK